MKIFSAKYNTPHKKNFLKQVILEGYVLDKQKRKNLVTRSKAELGQRGQLTQDRRGVTKHT